MREVLRVLTYHRVGDPADRPGLDPALVSATADGFERQMRHLARHYSVLPLHRVVDAFRGGASLPSRPVLITFDDAYRDFAEVAWPVLRRLGLPATLFVPTAFPGRPDRSFWWDRLHRAFASAPADEVRAALAQGPLRRADGHDMTAGEAFRRVREEVKQLPHREAMAEVDRVCRVLEAPAAPAAVLDWDEIRALRRDGVSVGSHSRTHALLTRLSPREAERELVGSRRDLAREIGEAPRAFSYPAGYHDDRVRRLVHRAGYEVAFTAVSGHNRSGAADPLALCRTGVARRTTPPVLALRLQRWFGPVDRWRKRDEHAREAGAGRSGR